MKETKQRSSELELLRIIAMLMIIAGHYAVIGIMDTIYNNPYLLWASGERFNRGFTSFFVAGGDTGVGIFFIISGFFLSGANKSRKINGIVCPVIFYAFIGILLNILFSSIYCSAIDYKAVLKLGVSPLLGNNWWFATSYVFLVLISPVVNEFINRLSNRKLLLVTIVVWVLWYCGGYALQLTFYGVERALFYYFIGAYIKRINKNKYTNRAILITVFVMSWVLYWLVTYIIGSSIGGLDVHDFFKYSFVTDILKMTRAVVLAPVCSISIFITFINIKMKHSSKINFIASTTFGIYLLHEVPINRKLLWDNIFSCDKIYQKSFNVVWHLPVTVITIFTIGFIVEVFRKKVFEDKMNQVYQYLFEINR